MTCVLISTGTLERNQIEEENASQACCYRSILIVFILKRNDKRLIFPKQEGTGHPLRWALPVHPKMKVMAKEAAATATMVGMTLTAMVAVVVPAKRMMRSGLPSTRSRAARRRPRPKGARAGSPGSKRR